ncbi:ArsR/SmtB family transcription factor [Streptomyces sp. NPDC056670]|uniref:ArsR/SmtB family transcription factor n=1 Tax=Streptomyces sp. NPDC056670 TaxID=3345904 RepID=UPI0036790EC4
MTRELLHPTLDEIRLENVMKALSDPVRMHIVRELSCTTGELSGASIDVPVGKATATHHYRVLRESGVIQQNYRGTAKMSTLRRSDLDALFPGFLDAALTAAVHEMARRRGCSSQG